MGLFHQLTIPDAIQVMKLVDEKNTDWHTHDFLEFAYIAEGTAYHQIGQRECLLQPGDYFIVDYDTPHRYTSDGIIIINCLFHPGMIHNKFSNIRSFEELVQQYFFGITGRRIIGPTADRIFHDDGTVGALFEQLVTEYKMEQDGYMEMLRSLLCQIIVRTIRLVGSSQKESELTRLLVKEIDGHFREPIRLEDICKRYHYSLSYTSGRFKAETGMTFTAALQSRRMEESCHLLAQTNLAVWQIAEQVGYHNMKFFNQIFKRVIGVTPREFRRQNQEG